MVKHIETVVLHNVKDKKLITLDNVEEIVHNVIIPYMNQFVVKIKNYTKTIVLQDVII